MTQLDLASSRQKPYIFWKSIQAKVWLSKNERLLRRLLSTFNPVPTWMLYVKLCASTTAEQHQALQNYI